MDSNGRKQQILDVLNKSNGISSIENSTAFKRRYGNIFGLIINSLSVGPFA